jgi:hypothetical protein
MVGYVSCRKRAVERGRGKGRRKGRGKREKGAEMEKRY